VGASGSEAADPEVQTHPVLLFTDRGCRYQGPHKTCPAHMTTTSTTLGASVGGLWSTLAARKDVLLNFDEIRFSYTIISESLSQKRLWIERLAVFIIC